MEQSTPGKFEEWGLLELFGHQRVAGKLSEQSIGGCAFIRVDVPEVDGRPGFTRFFTNGAIYSMSVLDESTARAMASALRPEPVKAYELPQLPPKAGALETVSRELDEEDCDLPY